MTQVCTVLLQQYYQACCVTNVTMQLRDVEYMIKTHVVIIYFGHY